MDEEGCPFIKVTIEEILEWFKPWSNSRVIKLVGKNVSPRIVIEQAKYLWKVKAKIFPTNLGNGYIIIQFSNEQDYETALFGGPWFISNHYLSVQRYTPLFESETNMITKMPLWVLFPSFLLSF